MMGIALWHFTVFLPDHFWGGIVGAFVGALIGAVLFGWLVNGFTIPGPDDTTVVTALEAIPGTLIGLGVIVRDRPALRAGRERPRTERSRPAPRPRVGARVRRGSTSRRARSPRSSRCSASSASASPSRRCSSAAASATRRPRAPGSRPARRTRRRRFAGIDDAVRASSAHVSAGARITVHGDYDVDGVCSTAILVRALRALGRRRRLVPAQPQRGRLRAERRRRSSGSPRAARGCWSPPTARSPPSRRSRARARAGIDVVVTDHHTPRADGALPDAPIVHPALCGYPCAGPVRDRRRLQARRRAARGRRPRPGPGRRRPRPRRARHRRRLRAARRREPAPRARGAARAGGHRRSPGCARSCASRRSTRARSTRARIGFRLAPRINAAGRLYRADAGLELVLTEDAERAAAIADELDRANVERRHTEQRILFEAEAQVAAAGRRSPPTCSPARTGTRA